MLLEIILAFLIGSIPTGYLLNKYFGHGDIRKVGSGNIGATNVLRHSGKLLGLLTLLIDIGKGFLALELLYGSGGKWTITILGSSVVLGHIFSPWLKFKGGKGVATMLGVIVFITFSFEPKNIFFVTTFSWLMIVFFTRYVALGSVGAAVSLPIFVALTHHQGGQGLMWFSLALAVFVTWAHRSNLKRLLAGTESRFRWRGDTKIDDPSEVT